MAHERDPKKDSAAGLVRRVRNAALFIITLVVIILVLQDLKKDEKRVKRGEVYASEALPANQERINVFKGFSVKTIYPANEKDVLDWHIEDRNTPLVTIINGVRYEQPPRNSPLWAPIYADEAIDEIRFELPDHTSKSRATVLVTYLNRPR